MGKFTCYRCQQTFTSDWTKEDAIREYQANFPGHEVEEIGDPLCDDCYEDFWRWAKENAPELKRRGN